MKFQKWWKALLFKSFILSHIKTENNIYNFSENLNRTISKSLQKESKLS